MNARRVGILLVIGTAACTARLYPGPTRPDVEVATIETDGMTIVAVDEQVAQPGLGPSRYEILAGMHAVSVRLNDNHPVFAGSAAGGHRVSDAALAVCFLARGKHVYLLRPLYAGAVWRVEVVDENVTGVIATKSTSAVSPDCSPEPPPAPPSPTPVAARDQVVPGSAPDGGAGPDIAGADVGTVASAPAAPPVRPARDTEVPRAYPKRSLYAGAAPPRPPPQHPGTGIGFELGLAFGGDELVRAELSNGETQTLHAGDGVLVAVVGDFTPFWIGDAVGFGLGASVAWKYADVSASNGSASLSRLPLSAFVQILPSIDGLWFLLLRGGLTEDGGATLSGSGVAFIPDVKFDSKLGGFADLGAYRASASSHVGVLFLARYTHEKFGLAGDSVDASSIGFNVGVYYSN